VILLAKLTTNATAYRT